MLDLLYRVVLLGILAFSLIVSYFVSQTRKKDPNIVNHLIKVLFDTLSIIAGALIACQYLKVNRQQIGIVMILVSIIIYLQIIIEVIAEPIKRNKIFLGLLLIFPLISSVYATGQLQTVVNTQEENQKKSSTKDYYVQTTENRNLRVRQQSNNQLTLSKDGTNKYNDFVTISGKTTPGVYVYCENPTDESEIFLTKANNLGKFSAIVPQKKLKNSVNFQLYVNGISILNDNTVKKDKNAKATEKLNVNSIPQKKALSDGSYNVDKDIKAGEYFLLSDGTGQINWQNGGQNSKSFDQSLYVKLAQDDSIALLNATLIPVQKDVGFGSSDTDNGMLKVGQDMAAGSYQVKATDDYSIAKVYSKPISSEPEEGTVLDSTSLELKNSQYVYLMNTRLMKE